MAEITVAYVEMPLFSLKNDPNGQRAQRNPAGLFLKELALLHNSQPISNDRDLGCFLPIQYTYKLSSFF